MKRRLLFLALCCGLAAVMLTGCGSSGNGSGSADSVEAEGSSVSAEKEPEKVNPKENTEVNTSNLEYSGLKVNLTTGMVTKSYSVPLTVDQLAADGFEVEFRSGGQNADAGTDHIEKAFIKYMNIPSFEVHSGTREILDIYDVDTSKSQSKEPVLVSLSMNGSTIGCGSSYDDLVKVFGEPDEIYRDEEQVYLCKYYSDCKVPDEILKGAQSNKVIEHQLDFNYTTGNITSLTVYFYVGGEIINDFDLRLGYYDTATGTSYRFY